MPIRTLRESLYFSRATFCTSREFAIVLCSVNTTALYLYKSIRRKKRNRKKRNIPSSDEPFNKSVWVDAIGMVVNVNQYCVVKVCVPRSANK